jgi:hypothetical protein
MSKILAIAAALGLILALSTFDAGARSGTSGTKVSGPKSPMTQRKGPATNRPPAALQGDDIITGVGPGGPGGHVRRR